jgi:hypothetical protein
VPVCKHRQRNSCAGNPMGEICASGSVGARVVTSSPTRPKRIDVPGIMTMMAGQESEVIRLGCAGAGDGDDLCEICYTIQNHTRPAMLTVGWTVSAPGLRVVSGARALAALAADHAWR